MVLVEDVQLGRKTLLGMLMTLAGLAVLLAIADGADATTVSVSEPVVEQGETVTITVTADENTVFTSSDQLRVTTPGACRYVATFSGLPAASEWIAPYPGDFDADPDNNAACRDDAHTFITSTGQGSTYTVVFDANEDACPQATFCTTDATGLTIFRTEMFEQNTIELTDELTITSRGHKGGAQVTLQVDVPGIANFDRTVRTADGSGEVVFTYALPREGGPGAWTFKISESGPSPGKAADQQGLSVQPTDLLVDWVEDPGGEAAVVERSQRSGAKLRLVYEGSIDNTVDPDVVLTDDDIADLQVFVSLPDGTQDTTGSLMHFDQQSGLWEVLYATEPGAPTGSYAFIVTAQDDDWGNHVVESVSEPFTLIPAIVAPEFSVFAEQAIRGGPPEFNMDVQLEYDDGTPVDSEDLETASNPDGTVELGFYQAGQRVGSGASLVATPAATTGRWEVVDQSIPPSVPTGEVVLRVVSPEVFTVAGTSAVNAIDTSVASEPVHIMNSQPTIDLAFLNEAREPIDAVLRGERVTFQVAFTYPSGAVVDAAAIGSDPGPTGVAEVRIVAPDTISEDGQRTPNVFRLPLTFDSAQQAWVASYTPEADDEVGLWRVTAVMSDKYGNRNQTQELIQVGLVVAAQVTPASGIGRGDEVDVTASVTLPGSDADITASVAMSVFGPDDILVQDVSMLRDTTTGIYSASFQVPNDAPLGSYRVEVRATNSKDIGLGYVDFSLGSAQIAVEDFDVGADEAPRLEELRVSFRLEYPNGDPLPDTTDITVNITQSGETVGQADVERVGTAWEATYLVPIDQALGPARISLSADDGSGNTIKDFTSQRFDIAPATIKVDDLATSRVRYDRGQTVHITATAAFVDGNPVPEATIPVDLFHGGVVVATVELTSPEHDGGYEGEYVIALDDPLSDSGAEWTLRIARDAVTDVDGNIGPSIAVSGESSFSVDVAFLSVDIVEQPEGGRVGDDIATLSFRLLAADGTALTEVPEGLHVVVLRGDTTLDEEIGVTLDNSTFTASFPLERGVLKGTYTFQVTGEDDFGNRIRETSSEAFDVGSAKDKDSPAAGALLGILGVVLVAWLRRR